MALAYQFIDQAQTFAASTNVNSPEIDVSAFRSASVDCHVISISGASAGVVFVLQSRTLSGKAYRAIVTGANQTATGHSYLDYNGNSAAIATIGLTRIQVQPNANITGLTVDVSAVFN